MVIYTLVLQFYFLMGKKKMIWRKKPEEKQKSATIMISVDRKGTVVPVKLKLQRESFDQGY